MAGRLRPFVCGVVGAAVLAALVVGCEEDTEGDPGRQPTVTLTSPNGGEWYAAGELRDITWSSAGAGGPVDIAYSTDGGSTWSLVAICEPNDGVYRWAVPGEASASCLVRVSVPDAGCSDVSDVVFAIDQLVPPGVWCVDADADPGGDGSSWLEAFQHPQAAVDAAFAAGGGEVWVAEGTYTNGGGGASPAPVLVMKAGVHVYGGFLGNEAVRGARDRTEHVTTLDGEGGAWHVVVGASNATLDGFVATRGNADGSAADANGAGMLNVAVSDLTVRDCVFSANTADQHGAGTYCEDSPSVTLARCAFDANSASDSGGGVCLAGATDAAVRNCVFALNTAGSLGGGVSLYDPATAVEVVNCTFLENSSAGNGGGIGALDGSGSLVNCVHLGDSPSSVSVLGGAGPWYLGSGYAQGFGPPWPVVDVADPDGPDEVWGTADDGLRLLPGSSCIDSANGDYAPPVDILGAPRHDDPGTANTGPAPVSGVTHADKGAYEFRGTSP